MKKYRFLLAATFVFALVFAFSCSSGDDGNNNGGGSSVTGGADGGGNQFSQIYNEDDGTAYKGSGVIKIVVYDKNGNRFLIDAGSVTNGIVKLELPPTIPNEYLRDFLEEDEWSTLTCTDYPEGIKSSSHEVFVLTDSKGEIIGYIGTRYDYGSFDEGIFYAYFTKVGKINCNLTVEPKRNQTYDIDAKVGWNKIYYHRTYPNDISKDEISTNNILTKEKEMKWYFTPEED
jgi:hypothetical protein